MRYGLNRHVRKHIVVSTVYAGKNGIERRDDIWRVKKRTRFTPKEIETIKWATKIDHGNAAMVVSINPLV
ncbi:hypothetical protein BK140_32425 [Paenibacillus macerans]|nr:hypothetical protein BK140_32425 [Paenibacillus macerans]